GPVRHSITLRLVLWLATTAAIIYSIAVWYDYRLSRDHIVAKSRLQAEQVVGSAVADLMASLAGVERSTDLLAQVLSNGLPPADELRELLRGIVAVRRDIYGAAIALEPGIVTPGAYADYWYHRQGVVAYADLSVDSYNYRGQDWY